MSTQQTQHPLIAYFQAQGLMMRKPYIIIVLGLFVLTFLTLLAAGQQLTAAGVDPEDAVLPFWAVSALLIIKSVALPAVIMRTRDAGMPIHVLAGTYAASLVLELLQMLTSGMLPEVLVGVVNLMAIVVLLALMFRPSLVKA